MSTTGLSRTSYRLILKASSFHFSPKDVYALCNLIIFGLFYENINKKGLKNQTKPNLIKILKIKPIKNQSSNLEGRI